MDTLEVLLYALDFEARMRAEGLGMRARARRIRAGTGRSALRHHQLLHRATWDPRCVAARPELVATLRAERALTLTRRAI